MNQQENVGKQLAMVIGEYKEAIAQKFRDIDADPGVACVACLHIAAEGTVDEATEEDFVDAARVAWKATRPKIVLTGRN